MFGTCDAEEVIKRENAMAGLSDSELQEVRQMLDRRKIYDNVVRYCRGLDRFDLDLLKASYWPDALDNHGSFVGNAYEFCERAVAGRKRFRNMNHHVSNTQFEFISDTQAKVETYFLVLCTWITAEGDREYSNGGRYKDLYEKRGDEWRILRRVCVYDWCRDQPSMPNWERAAIPKTELNWGAFAPGDPIYGTW